jgi:hypothetical protein
MAVRARVRVDTLRYDTAGCQVIMHPVYSEDKDDPNYTYSQYTPSGEISLYITNPDAYNYFKIGGTVELMFIPHDNVKA